MLKNPASAERHVRVAATLLLIALITAHSWRPLDGSSDFWAHAAVGRWIVQHGQIPHTTLFLWSFHQDWVAHSWLSEIIFYGVMHLGGEVGGPYMALILTAILASCAILWAGGYVRGPRQNLLFVLITILCIEASGPRFLPRPELLSSLLLLALLTTLWRLESVYKNGEPDSKNRRALFAAIFLDIFVWTNIHGGVITGCILAVLFVLALGVQMRRKDVITDAAIVTLLCLVATLLNPYGAHYYSIYRQINTYTFSVIEEWRPFWQSPILNPSLVVDAFLVFGAAVYGWLHSRHRSWAQLAVMLLMLALFLQARRNIYLFCLTCLFVASQSGVFELKTDEAWSTIRLKEIPATTARSRGLLPLIVGAAVVVSYCIWLGNAISLTGGWPLTAMASTNMPIKQADYILKVDPDGRVFNDYNDGSYFDWRFGGSPGLYVDGINAYPDGIMEDYSYVLQVKPEGLHLLDETGVNCIAGRLLMSDESKYPPLYNFLANDPHCTQVVFPGEGPVWLLMSGGNGAATRK